MKALRNVVFASIVVAAVWFLLGLVWPTYSLFSSFDRLEQNARRAVTGQQLQAWATNLLAQQPPGYTTAAALGTNFPSQLMGLWRHPPSIVINEGDTNEATFPSWVGVTWGSGFLGHCGFEIGPTNFTGNKGGTAWHPGVYFWKD